MTRELLSTREAAAMFGLKPNTLEHWRTIKVGPPFVRIGPRTVRYRLQDLTAYFDAQRVGGA